MKMTHDEEDQSDTETAFDSEFLDDTHSDPYADLHRPIDIEREHAGVADAHDLLKRLRREEILKNNIKRWEMMPYLHQRILPTVNDSGV